MRSVVVLPQPDGPSRHVELAVVHLELQVLRRSCAPPRSFETRSIRAVAAGRSAVWRHRIWNPSASLPPITCLRASDMQDDGRDGEQDREDGRRPAPGS